MKENGVDQYLKYSDVLQAIHNTENHLLIGNGFNRGLGVNTSYKNIFQKMFESENSVYADALEVVKKSNYDLEYFIGDLLLKIPEDDLFLRKYLSNKIKMDFMQAAQKIVKSEIHKVYSDSNDGVIILLKNFTNYFTLNYDSLLYLLLMEYKSTSNMALAFQPTLNFQKHELNVQYNNIYNEVKRIREDGSLKILIKGKEATAGKAFKMSTRDCFVTGVKEYSESGKKGWNNKEISRTVKLIFEEEKVNAELPCVDDGFRQKSLFEQEEYVFDVEKKTQNLFFLHGAFHIYKDGMEIKKITQQTDKALYERLDEILNSNDKEIVCIFQTENKKSSISDNIYLSKCLEKLSTLSGTMVIIGCAFSDNDQHIFEGINRSSIDTLYISAIESELEKVCASAKAYFPEKKVLMFDASTISYNVAEKTITLEE